ncbi:hypothetical protein LMG6871_01169 [Ralstonia edaphis]|uniref:DUF1571 domain-containing protein n=1 Tax=Ralstonia edaphi TaxID=3058599 RepID=UPI0028F615AE|nr:DUF1571 domain-containing protein [Ralstonia sp. LMG 6871]CAJ0714630.1 hypothetical protein LMG6871_01169 [Ralstonia sp. LMG 6871]
MQLRTLALATVLAGAAHAWAQPAAPDASASAAAAPTAASATASQSAAIGSFAAMDIARQTAWLTSQVNANAFAAWSDEDVLAMAQAMKPETLVRWLKAEVARLPEYEYRMRRQERVKDQWQSQPALMLIRYRNAPRQVYARWLKGGAHAGQEIIYDETVRKDEMYGHLGGLVGFVAIWSALDGSLAKSQSNHTARELGLQFIVDSVERDGRAHVAAGGSGKFNEAKMVTEDGERMLRLTWDAPSGPPTFYAKRVRLYFDLKNPWVRIEEAWDESGNQLEKIVIESVTRKTWNDQTFNPKNPEYKF